MRILLLLGLLVSCASTNQTAYELAGQFCSCRGGVKNFVDFTEDKDNPKHYVACQDNVYSAFYGTSLNVEECYPKDVEIYSGDY